MNCVFTKFDTYYECLVNDTNFVIKTGNEKIAEVKGYHVEGLTNNDVTQLNFTNIKFYCIPHNLSTFFPNINSIYVDCNNYKIVWKETLAQFNNLRKFSVISNRLAYLSEINLFEFNKNISRISIEGMTLKSIHPEMITDTSKITQITIIGKTIFHRWTKDESSFEVFWDQIASNFPLPSTIYCVYQVKNDQNSFYSCVIESLVVSDFPKQTDNIYGFHKLENNDSMVLEIEVKSSKTKFFPTCLGVKFKNVRIVRINAAIEGLEQTNLENFTNLQELYISNNNISTILSNTFINNQNLKLINLQKNPITTIGIGAFWIPGILTHLQLESFNFENRSDIENYVVSLRNSNYTLHDALFCDYQKITLSFVGFTYTCIGKNSDPPKMFVSATSIAFGKHFYAHSNENVEAVRITEYNFHKKFSFCFHKSFANLKYIQLYRSKIEEFHNDSFSQLKDLKVLDISFNAIKRLNGSIFEDVKNLIYINLKGNHLKFISPEIFSSNNQLSLVNFADNFCVNTEAVGSEEIDYFIKFIMKNCSDAQSVSDVSNLYYDMNLSQTKSFIKIILV